MAAARQFKRNPNLFRMAALAAVLFTASAVMNFWWFGELSALYWLAAALWVVLAVLYRRRPDYAVVSSADIVLWDSPIRPRTIEWSSVIGAKRIKAGVQLNIRDGKIAVVRLGSVQSDQREQLVAELERHVGRLGSA